jgi:hypothetical protein
VLLRYLLVFFFFFGNLQELFNDDEEDGGANELLDETVDDDEEDEDVLTPLPEYGVDPDEPLEFELGDEDAFITPSRFLFGLIWHTFEIYFIYILYDFYLTYILDIGFFLLLIKSFYYFFTYNTLFEMFCFVDFLRKIKVSVIFFYFIPVFVLLFFLYYSPRIYRYLSETVQILYSVDNSFWRIYPLKMFSTKVKDLLYLFIFSFTPSRYRQKYYNLFSDDYQLFPELQTTSLIHVFTRFIPRMIIFLLILIFSFFVSNLCIDIIVFLLSKINWDFLYKFIEFFVKILYKFDFDFLYKYFSLVFFILNFYFKFILYFFMYIFCKYTVTMVSIFFLLVKFLYKVLIFFLSLFFLVLKGFIVVIDSFFLITLILFFNIKYLFLTNYSLFLILKGLLLNYNINLSFFLFLFFIIILFFLFYKFEKFYYVIFIPLYLFILFLLISGLKKYNIIVLNKKVYIKFLLFLSKKNDEMLYLWHYISIVESQIVFFKVLKFLYLKLTNLITFFNPLFIYLNNLKYLILAFWFYIKFIIIFILIVFFLIESYIYLLKHNKEFIYRVWFSYKDFINNTVFKGFGKRKSFFIVINKNYHKSIERLKPLKYTFNIIIIAFDVFNNNKDTKKNIYWPYKFFKTFTIRKLGLSSWLYLHIRIFYRKILYVLVKLKHYLKKIFIFLVFIFKLLLIPFFFFLKIIDFHLNIVKYLTYFYKVFNEFKLKWFSKTFLSYIKKKTKTEVLREQPMTLLNRINKFLSLFIRKQKNAGIIFLSKDNLLKRIWLKIVNFGFRKKRKYIHYKSSVYYRHFLCFQKYKNKVREIDKILAEKNKNIIQEGKVDVKIHQKKKN